MCKQALLDDLLPMKVARAYIMSWKDLGVTWLCNTTAALEETFLLILGSSNEEQLILSAPYL